MAFLEREIPDIRRSIDVDVWIDGEGLPPDARRFTSAKLDTLRDLIERWNGGQRPNKADLAGLDATEWQVLLAQLPHVIPLEDCAWLDQAFKLSRVENAEIRAAWLTIAAASQYAPCYAAIRETLLSIGRMKYLRPLYTALAESGPRGRELAHEIFAAAKDGYHPVAQALVEGILKSAAEDADARQT